MWGGRFRDLKFPHLADIALMYDLVHGVPSQPRDVGVSQRLKSTVFFNSGGAMEVNSSTLKERRTLFPLIGFRHIVGRLT